MLDKGWLKSVKVALLAGLMAFAGVAEAKDVCYISGYWGKPGSDGAHMVVKTESGDEVEFPISNDDVLVVRAGNSDTAPYGTSLDLAYVSTDSEYIPKNIRIEKNFTLNPGVTNKILSGTTIEIVDGVKLTIASSKWTLCSVGTVVFDGDGTIDLSGVKEIDDPLTIAAGMKFMLPTSYTGGIVVTDPENLDPADYPDYVISIDEEGVAHLVKKDQVVAFVGETAYPTLAEAFAAAKPAGTIRLAVKPDALTPVADFKDDSKWSGTVEIGEITTAYAYDLSKWGNTNSKICLNGYKNYPCAPSTISYNVGRDVVAGAWVIEVDGAELWGQFKNFGFNYAGNLEGSGTLKISNTGDNSTAQNYIRFKGNPSAFTGSIDMTGSGYRLILAPSTAGVAEAWTNISTEKPMIHVSGVAAQVAEGKTWTAKTIKVNGTIKGSGTLNGAAVFGDDAVIDLKDGVLTASGAVTFGSALTLKNAEEGAVVLRCSSKPTNLETVKIKDIEGNVMPLAHLEFANGEVTLSGMKKKLVGAATWNVTAEELSLVPHGYTLDLSDYAALDIAPVTLPAGTTEADIQAFLNKLTVIPPSIRTNATLAVSGTSLAIAYEPMTLYWAAWRGTFWEHIGQTDKNGNHGLMRDVSGNIVAHRPNDTVVFDSEHYTTDDFWHWGENLYIKQEVLPGSSNEWDIKILEGRTLKLGFCGASSSGQNLTQNFKIYVEEGSTLELGYWGNTHHREGLLRDNVTFGGAGKVALGEDLGSKLVVKNVSGTATMDLNGKELALTGGTVANPITGMGTLSGSGTISSDIDIPIGATLDLSGGLVFTGNVTFNDSVTINLTAAPTEKTLLMTAAEGKSFVLTNTEIDVLVKVNGVLEPAFYTFEVDGDKLYVKPAEVKIDYTAQVVLGFDYKTMICRVTMNPAIEGVVAEVTVNGVAEKLKTWTAPVIGMRNQGRAEVMVGDADDNFVPGDYSMTVSIGAWKKELNFRLSVANDGNLATVNGVGYTTMKKAVEAAGATGTIKLLTNVFFAPPPGNYVIERGEYDIFIVNDMEMTADGNAVMIAAPETISHYVVMQNDEGEDLPFVVEGNWLGAALPWKTKKAIQTALMTESENGLRPFEAYVLGIFASEMRTARLIARGVETGDPDTIEITDGLSTKSAAKTGVVVTKTLIDAETKAVVSETATYDLRTMSGKAQLLRLKYVFTADAGQE